MKRIAVVGTVVVVLAGVSAVSLTGGAKTMEAPAPVRPVKVLKIDSSPLAEAFELSGEIRARVETPMAFRVPGRIAVRHVDVGATVHKGQVLAELDATDYRLNVQTLGAQVASAHADLAFQRAELARGAELLKKGFISDAAFERHQNAYKGVQSKVRQAQSALAQARNQADYTALRALSDGIVTGIDAEAGQVVTAGQTVMRIARPEEKEVAIHVPENRLEEVRAAQALRVSLWARPGKRYRGSLRELSPAADRLTRTYAGKVAILDPDAAVQIGMTATVTIDGDNGSSGHVVPLGAIVARDGGTYVWRVEPSTSTVDLVHVRLGRYHGNRVAVLAGLADDDYVVTAGVHKLFPHQQVSILGEQAP